MELTQDRVQWCSLILALLSLGFCYQGIFNCDKMKLFFAISYSLIAAGFYFVKVLLWALQ
jgi:hypothetical protein